MKTLKVNKEKLEGEIESALRTMNRFSWTGWGIPIYLDLDTGEVSSGGILSQNTWVPSDDDIELLRVETWEDEFQNSIPAWYADNLPKEVQKEVDDILTEKGIDIEALSVDDLPEKAREDYEEYQELLINEAIPEIIERYNLPEMVRDIDEDIEIELT